MSRGNCAERLTIECEREREGERAGEAGRARETERERERAKKRDRQGEMERETGKLNRHSQAGLERSQSKATCHGSCAEQEQAISISRPSP